MFSIYGHFESVSIVRSFGRIKTMAYIRYSNAIVTRSVLHSFLKENDVSDEIQVGGIVHEKKYLTCLHVVKVC